MNMKLNLLKTNTRNRIDNCVIYSLQFYDLKECYLLIVLSEETHVLTKQEVLLGKGTWVESSRVRKPRRAALPCGSQSRVLW